MELVRTIDEMSNATRYHIQFGFSTMISLNAKTHIVPQFIGAPQRNFETANFGSEKLAPLALDGWVNPSDTIFLATEIFHHL